jgi:hypothetical protein
MTRHQRRKPRCRHSRMQGTHGGCCCGWAAAAAPAARLPCPGVSLWSPPAEVSPVSTAQHSTAQHGKVRQGLAGSGKDVQNTVTAHQHCHSFKTLQPLLKMHFSPGHTSRCQRSSRYCPCVKWCSLCAAFATALREAGAYLHVWCRVDGVAAAPAPAGAVAVELGAQVLQSQATSVSQGTCMWHT